MNGVEPIPTDSPKPDSDGRQPAAQKDTEFKEEPVEAVDEHTGEESSREALQALRGELEQARAQAAEYLDGWQRARAEFANYKRRVETEREEIRRVSNEALLLKLLPVVDDFERAFRTIPEDLSDVPWVNGMNMIFRKLQTILESEHITPIEATGQPFDPLLHEAVMQVETDEYPDHQVMEEMQRGYRLGERVLRPTMVKVASNPSQPAQEGENHG